MYPPLSSSHPLLFPRYAGVKYAPPAVISLVGSAFLLASVLFVYLIVGNVPSVADYVGGGVILGAIVYAQAVALRGKSAAEMMQARPRRCGLMGGSDQMKGLEEALVALPGIEGWGEQGGGEGCGGDEDEDEDGDEVGGEGGAENGGSGEDGDGGEGGEAGVDTVEKKLKKTKVAKKKRHSGGRNSRREITSPVPLLHEESCQLLLGGGL